MMENGRGVMETLLRQAPSHFLIAKRKGGKSRWRGSFFVMRLMLAHFASQLAPSQTGAAECNTVAFSDALQVPLNSKYQRKEASDGCLFSLVGATGFIFRASGLVLAKTAAHSPCAEKPGPANAALRRFATGFKSLHYNTKKKRGCTSLFLWSGRRDLNPRPFGPEPNALPNCATPRMEPMKGLEPLTRALRMRCSTN